MHSHIGRVGIVIVATLCLHPVQASEPTAVGLWQQVDRATGKPDAWFLVSQRNGSYYATVVRLFVRPRQNAKPICTGCLGNQKDAPWLGLTIVARMERNGLDYEGGTILDPRDGSEYFGRMQLSPDGRTLTVRGYLGIDPLGGDEVWRRLPKSTLKAAAPAKGAATGSTSLAAASGTNPRARH